MKILIVEDDKTLLSQLSQRIRSEGYAVDEASTGEDGLHLIQESPIDLAIVDLGLPDFSGIELIKTARKKGSKIPVLILTARNKWQEKVEGLEAGADDYMVKPFEIEELLARIRVLLRRQGGWTQSVLHCGPISLEPSTHTVTKKGKKIELTSFEFKVLEYLMTHAGEVISKTKLSDHIYEEDADRDSNVMEVFIRRLRKKLDEDGKLNIIETIRGEGYKFTLDRNT
ncbi:MAG: response regulator transcription factor [Proteobacteria bacterium]|jgi:two-component system response regulator PhoP|nr:response regulator transcription factor [Pseudomonadota bacterium]